MKTLFEKSRPGRRAYRPVKRDIPAADGLSTALQRETPADLPELSELDIVRHYSALERRNFGVDIGFYPLGSCTMKYNPKINEQLASLREFTAIHPLQDISTVQGSLGLCFRLGQALCRICGMNAVSLQPFAGAHGEFTAMKIFRAWFDHTGQQQRKKMLVPDSSHGTNPASAHLAGFEVIEIKSDERGMISAASLGPWLNDELAGIMMTNPNTLGLFEQDISLIAEKIHKAGGLLYYDGANLNAVTGKVKPGDMGFDAVHVNLHKTFSTPHGGGGPGSGPVLVTEKLAPYLPAPVVIENDNGYSLDFSSAESIGRVSGFWGNFAVCSRAWAYILAMGSDGMTRVSEMAVLNANYVRACLQEDYTIPFPGLCKHEFVLSASDFREKYDISAMDIAKGLIEAGIHPPTVYFPLIVPEALMIEPTENESPETLDEFIRVMHDIAHKAVESPSSLKEAPVNMPVRRVDETLAARKPVLRYRDQE
ncbi:MAG: aminomethyl-transferring glycine dehydrogenase subunit GcvPB [Spirochaetales bacterium]|nr:aminomethyl-transferring glycine dehydrogenase subunit GcvPB [Spirochaetales bacterium]